MARVNLKKDDVITKILINIKVHGKVYKDICLEYEEDADWKLTWEDIHYEGNDSLCFGKVGDNVIDFHIHGQDDELGTNFNKKERIFSMIAYTPKATVQAAIGGIPLSLGLACGDIVLTVAVLAIVITAPLGAFAIDSTYKKLLMQQN